MTIKDMRPGERGVINSEGGDGALRRHFLDMGVIPGAEVRIVKLAPMGDPIQLLIHGYELTMRLSDAENISVTLIDEHTAKEKSRSKYHPGLGQGGKYHPKGSGKALPDGTVLTFALVGNQNAGKTTLFNQLTGSNQHVGNFPGVTVDRRDGVIKGHDNTLITDLPGIYSMSPYSSEEIVSRNFVINEKPKAIINILDATNIERNLYLTMQLMEMEVPMVIALNMMDEMTGNGGFVDINTMEDILGVPVVPIAASKNQGVQELVEHAIHLAMYQERPGRVDFCDESDHGGALHECIHTLMALIKDDAEKAGLPLRFAACRLIEGDELIEEQLKLNEADKTAIEEIISNMERERGLDRNAAMADMRFAFIKGVTERAVTKPKESREHVRSNRIDKLLTGKYTAIPMFILIMGAVFFLTFNVIGSRLQELMGSGVDYLSGITEAAMDSAAVSPILKGLVIEGIFAGVGSVLSFMPIIVIMFLFLSLLEDSGYIARVAFFMDKPLRRLGLSGRSIVPLLVGFGCSVPAVMATRTLPSDRDRKMTILLTPFVSCSAKLPIYGFFVTAFFPAYAGPIMIGLYFLGIMIGIFSASLYKRTLFKGEPVPFVMELPNYRLPGIKNSLRLMWEKAKDFLTRAFTIILVATVAVWLLKRFGIGFNYVEDPEDSVLAMISGWLAPLFAPIGLGDWRIVTALISGFMAKESVVSMLEVLFGSSLTAVMSTVTAASLLVFSLLYTPCVAAIASIKRELGAKWAVGVVFWQCAIAWLASLIVVLIGICLG